jgi:hypothetical protein
MSGEAINETWPGAAGEHADGCAALQRRRKAIAATVVDGYAHHRRTRNDSILVIGQLLQQRSWGGDSGSDRTLHTGSRLSAFATFSLHSPTFLSLTTFQLDATRSELVLA